MKPMAWAWMAAFSVAAALPRAGGGGPPAPTMRTRPRPGISPSQSAAASNVMATTAGAPHISVTPCTATGSLRVSLQVVDSCRVRAAPNGDPRGAIVIECEARSPYKVSEEQTLERDGPVTRRIVTY